jgi:hypothetical protein
MPGCGNWSARTPGYGWSVTCSNEPSPSGSRNSRHRDALPVCRCPEGGGLSGSSRLHRGRVTRSAYYAWTTRATQGPSDHDREEIRLVAEVRRIHARSGGTYGVPRVHAERRRRGWTVNYKRVERLMRRHGIVGYRPRRRRSLTKPDQGAAPAPDLLGRLFDPERPEGAGLAASGGLLDGRPPTTPPWSWAL